MAGLSPRSRDASQGTFGHVSAFHHPTDRSQPPSLLRHTWTTCVPTRFVSSYTQPHSPRGFRCISVVTRNDSVPRMKNGAVVFAVQHHDTTRSQCRRTSRISLLLGVHCQTGPERDPQFSWPQNGIRHERRGLAERLLFLPLRSVPRNSPTFT